MEFDNHQKGAFMVRITAANLQRHLRRCLAIAITQPVMVTHCGHESLVVVTLSEYNRLKAVDQRRAVHPWELPDDLAAALEKAEPPEFTRQFNREI